MRQICRPSLTLASSALALLGVAANAQTTETFGPSRSLVTDGTITETITVPAGFVSTGTLNVTYAGDFGSTTETADVRIDGTSVGTIGATGNDCGQDFTASFTIDEATLSAAAADGSVEISFVAGVGGNAVNNFAGTQVVA